MLEKITTNPGAGNLAGEKLVGIFRKNPFASGRSECRKAKGEEGLNYPSTKKSVSSYASIGGQVHTRWRSP